MLATSPDRCAARSINGAVCLSFAIRLHHDAQQAAATLATCVRVMLLAQQPQGSSVMDRGARGARLVAGGNLVLVRGQEVVDVVHVARLRQRQPLLVVLRLVHDLRACCPVLAVTNACQASAVLTQQTSDGTCPWTGAANRHMRTMRRARTACSAAAVSVARGKRVTWYAANSGSELGRSSSASARSRSAASAEAQAVRASAPRCPWICRAKSLFEKLDKERGTVTASWEIALWHAWTELRTTCLQVTWLLCPRQPRGAVCDGEPRRCQPHGSGGRGQHAVRARAAVRRP